jgi:hypothetical protein
MRLLRQQSFFKEIEKKNWVVWADCGSHFRCKELSYFLFNELRNAPEQIIVNLNFFGEKHGKNSRDQHFSAISIFC